MRIGWLGLGFLWVAGSVFAQPASDLLQSGIYSQETLGDLDAAIRIYRQILNSGNGLRLYAAQAQYRLGTCLLRKGDRAEAAEAFRAVIREYPEQRELAARARENLPGGNDLLRAPWSQTEVAEYRWTIPGVQDGWSICRIGSSPGQSARLGIQMSVYAPRLFTTQLDLDRNSMRPLQLTHRSPANGNPHVEYRDGARGSSSRSPGYEYGELLYLLRRMPLAAGWSSNIPLVTEDQTPLAMQAAVTGVEEVVVPAGTFKCFRVRLTSQAAHHSVTGTDWPVSAAGEALWYGVSGARPLVKIESGAFIGELASLRTAEQIGTSSYRDPEVGYSFTLPAGWVFHPRGSYNPPGTSVDLIDYESQVRVVISGKSKRMGADQIEGELQSGATERLGSRSRKVKSYKLRGPMKHERLDGHAALTAIADYNEGGHNWVELITWVQSEATRASIAVQVDAVEFESFRRRFQSILDSFRMP